MFVEHLTHDIAALQECYEKTDYAAWDEWVHKLYGACSHIGAIRLAELCDEGQSLMPERCDEISDIHRVILDEYERLKSILDVKRAA